MPNDYLRHYLDAAANGRVAPDSDAAGRAAAARRDLLPGSSHRPQSGKPETSERRMVASGMGIGSGNATQDGDPA
jgi:hypothetical protein